MLPLELTHPGFDPVALRLGPLQIYWYAVMYLSAFVLAWSMLRRRVRRTPYSRWDGEDVDALLLGAILGVMLGGRLGYVLFYDLATYLRNPVQVFALWQGGMSFHGGVLGVAVALLWFARTRGVSLLTVADFLVPAAPLGLALGRFGNFINGELWGRPAPASLPWAMVFPQVDAQPRHPSQLYELLTEGIALFVAVSLVDRAVRRLGNRRRGYVAGTFVLGYGGFRFLCEHFREPDAQLGLLGFGMSMGQWLCVPMIVAGLGLLAFARWGRQRAEAAAVVDGGSERVAGADAN